MSIALRVVDLLFDVFLQDRILRAWDHADINTLNRAQTILPCPYCDGAASSTFHRWPIDHHFGLFDNDARRLDTIYCRNLQHVLPGRLFRHYIRKAHELLARRSSVEFRRCAHCDLVYRNFPLHGPSAAHYYAVLYRLVETESRDNSFGRANIPSFVRRKEALGDYFLARSGLQPGTRILDLGCAEGVVCRFFAQQGFDAYGIEPSVPMVRYARETLGLTHVTQGSYSPESYAPDFFDGIVSHHVLEHVVDIRSTLGAIARHLRPGGHLLLQTPCVDLLREPADLDYVVGRDHIYGYSERFFRTALAATGIEIKECRKTPPDLAQLPPEDLVRESALPYTTWGDVNSSISLLGIKVA